MKAGGALLFNIVYVLNAPMMKSIDGGKTFTNIPVPHGDNHYLWINPDNIFADGIVSCLE